MADEVSHLVFDVESVADGDLIASVRYPGENLSADEAVSRYQDELMEQRGTTFIPLTFQIPIAVAIAKVTKEYRLVDIVSLDEPHFRSHVITDTFWRGWEAYRRPQWVTFNGRSFDIPLMELAAYRYGISLPTWFSSDGYKAPRNRYNQRSHLDLQELLTNFGASRFNGGLNLAAQLLGKPGKVCLTGDQVQKQFDEGDLTAISDYCRCDVLDTYFVFLRSMLLTGQLTLEQEMALVEDTRTWISQRCEECEAYSVYLDCLTDWKNPWLVNSTGSASHPQPYGHSESSPDQGAEDDDTEQAEAAIDSEYVRASGSDSPSASS